MNLDLDNMDAEEQHELRQSSPFSLQALCRLSLMPGFTISDCPNRRFTRDALQHLGSDAAELIAALETQAPRPFTREAFRHLGHAAKVNCLKSVAQVNIDRLDFSSVEQTDLENFLSVIKYNMNVTNVLSIEKLFSAAKGVVPFGEEETCVHHNRQICTKCSQNYCKDYCCPCQPFWTPTQHHGRDYSDCTCRKRGLYISVEGVDLTPDSTRGMINFLKNVSEVRFGPWFGDGSCKSQHVHFDIETFKEVIGSLKQSSCKTIEFCSNWKTTFCDESHRHVTPESVKVCARNLGWKYKICDVGLQIWEPNYPTTQLPWEPFCHCRDKANRTCMY